MLLRQAADSHDLTVTWTLSESTLLWRWRLGGKFPVARGSGGVRTPRAFKPGSTGATISHTDNTLFFSVFDLAVLEVDAQTAMHE